MCKKRIRMEEKEKGRKVSRGWNREERDIERDRVTDTGGQGRGEKGLIVKKEGIRNGSRNIHLCFY